MNLDRRNKGEIAWLTSFGDLIGILLANFVLLFSMSSLNESRWRGVSPTVANLGVVATDEAGTQGHSGPDSPGSVPAIGEPTDYLYALVRARLAPVAGVTVERTGAGLFVRLLPPGGVAANDAATDAIQAVAAALAPLPNTLDILGCIGKDADWTRALSRAVDLASRLRGAGLARDTGVLAVADPVLCQADGGLVRIGIERG